MSLIRSTSSLPSSFEEIGGRYFSTPLLIKAQKVLQESKLSISFQKGSPERYFIVSGLFLGGNNYQTKVSYKKEIDELTQEERVTVSSQCNCVDWTADKHCPHSAALFINFCLHHKALPGQNRNLPGQVIIRPSHFGQIVWSPLDLEGVSFHHQFNTINYLLTNETIIPLPSLSPWEPHFELQLKLVPKAEVFGNVEHLASLPFEMNFSLIKGNEVELQNISLFEGRQIFDWDLGKLYELPETLIQFLSQLKQINHFEIDDIINRSRKIPSLKILVDRVTEPVSGPENYPPFETKIVLENSIRKGYFTLRLINFEFGPNGDEQLISSTSFHRLFTGGDGSFRYFNGRHDALEFLRRFFTHPIDAPFDLKKALRNIRDKDIWADKFEFFQQTSDLVHYCHLQRKFYSLNSQQLLAFFHYCWDLWQDNFFRFSTTESGELIFELQKKNLWEKLNDFYFFCERVGISVFYGNDRVKRWHSQIRFERNKNNLNWFEITMNVPEHELKMLSQLDTDNNYVLSQEGLVLFTPEERDLLRLFKKYTQGQKETTGDGGKFNLLISRSRIFELFELYKLGLGNLLTEADIEFCQRLMNLKELPQYPIPEHYLNIARPYQLNGLQWLRFLYESKLGACLADDMGLGKTLQVIMFIESIVDKIDKVLIVCPVSILLNWQNEIKKFSSLTVDIYYGNDREVDLNSKSKILLTSYGVMKKEVMTKLSEKEFDIIVFDEVQHLKNHRSLGASSARQLKSKFRICLTGTPVENDISEFFNILDLALPGLWNELQVVRSKVFKETRSIAKKIVRPFILRRTKQQVLTELPEKVENHVYLNFSQEERAYYTGHLIQIRRNVESSTIQRKYGEILKGLLQLRQMCLWQKLEQLTSTKIDFLMENLDSIIQEGHKVIIFSQFTTYLDMIQDQIIKNSWKYSRIDGSQSLTKRQDQVDKFQQGDSVIFLISLKAGGFGLNLTAASFIFLMDPWWNPAVENQAIDRAYRIGQKNKLTVYRPIIKDSVEEKVIQLQEQKKELFHDLLGGDTEDHYNGKLTMDDFKMLLS